MGGEISSAALLDRVAREIHPRCEMYGYARRAHGEDGARNYYFHSAAYLVERMHAFLEEQGLRPEELSLLDFAAGYGRFTRFFVHLFREVVVSDLDPEMLEFDRRCFGVGGFLSHADPARLAGERRFDVVFCFSLFTHLPEPAWSAWLGRLADLVAPGGLLLFSTRSPELAAAFSTPRVGGAARALLSEPLLAQTRRTLSVYGVRLSAPAGADGALAVQIGVRSEAPWWVEAPRLANERPIAGLRLGPASAEPLGTNGTWQALSFRIPFATSVAVADTAIGPLVANLRFRSPTRARLEPEDGRPQIAIDERDAAPAPSDFVFVPTNETGGRLDAEGYGSTTVSDDYVRRAAESLGSLAPVRHFARGELDLFHDVYALRKL